MKKLLIIILLLPIGLKAQEKFQGIGFFKIGLDTAKLLEYAKENKLKGKEISTENLLNSWKYMGGKKILCKIVSGKNPATNISQALICPETSVYYMKLYEVGGIKIENIFLTFYQNRLIKFSSDYAFELDEAMKSKYKDFKDESKVDTSKCLAKMTGIKYDLIAHDNITRWYNDGIIATSRIYDYFTDNCEESSGSLFYYHETEGYNKLLSLTNKIADEKEQKKTNIKASKLTDF